MLTIIRYTAERRQEWDNFVATSKNGTFLLMRSYMDYHSDRFADCSLMFYADDTLYAVLPANVAGNTLHTHQGLTYGGLIMSGRCTTAGVLQLFDLLTQWMRAEGLTQLVYKPIPHIYSPMPAEEDLYALFRHGARLTARGVSSTVAYANRPKWHKDRHTALNRAHRNEVRVDETDDIRPFWSILSRNLQERHGVHPVHTVEEMELLMSRFPNNISLFEATCGDECVGGILVFKTGRVLHSQYLAASPHGRKCGAIEAIMEVLLQQQGYTYFDFGISTENGGTWLNEGLIYQKEGFGCRATCYDTYTLLLP